MILGGIIPGSYDAADGDYMQQLQEGQPATQSENSLQQDLHAKGLGASASCSQGSPRPPDTQLLLAQPSWLEQWPT
jgi:hypothetical protein